MLVACTTIDCVRVLNYCTIKIPCEQSTDHPSHSVYLSIELDGVADGITNYFATPLTGSLEDI